MGEFGDVPELFFIPDAFQHLYLQAFPVQVTFVIQEVDLDGLAGSPDGGAKTDVHDAEYLRLVKAGTNEPDAELTGKIAAGAFKQGVILLTCGTYGNVIRFLPPLSISDDLLREGLGVVVDLIKANA